MRRLIAIVAFIVLSACTAPTLPGVGSKPSPTPLPSSRCADLVASAWTGGPVDGVAACLDPKTQKDIGVEKDSDFNAWVLNGWMSGSFPMYDPNHDCGLYFAKDIDKFYDVKFFEADGSVVVYGYAVTVSLTYTKSPPKYSLLALGVAPDGKVRDLADIANSKTECPTGKTGVTK